MSTVELNKKLADFALRIRALLEQGGAKVAYISFSTFGFVLRTDELGALIAMRKLAQEFSTFTVKDATPAEIAHFGDFTHTVRGHI